MSSKQYTQTRQITEQWFGGHFLKVSTVLKTIIFSTLMIVTTAHSSPSQKLDVLKVCADPNNLPYSNQQEQGFENKIAQLLAQYFDAKLEYTWFPQRMGFIRNTLKNWSDKTGEFACDLVIGVPSQFDQAATSQTYYRSAYAMVFKPTGALKDIHNQDQLAALTDTQKADLKVASFSPSPTVKWIQDHGFSDQTRYFRIMNGDPEDYPGKLVGRVASGDFDLLFIWGPIAGYFAKQFPELRVVPMSSEGKVVVDFPFSMAVRYGERDWKASINQALKDNKNQIKDILESYQVPIVEASSAPMRDDDD